MRPYTHFFYLCVYSVPIKHIQNYMHACMHAYIHACVRASVRACVRTYIRVYVHACIRARVYACMHTCVHTCIGVCVHTCTRVCVHAYMRAYVRAHIHESNTRASIGLSNQAKTKHKKFGDEYLCAICAIKEGQCSNET